MGTYRWCVPGVCAGGRVARGPRVRSAGLLRCGACTGKPPPRFFAAFQDTRRRRRWPWAPALHTSGLRGKHPGTRTRRRRCSPPRAHAEAMIVWAGSEQSLALEHEQLESETMKAGFEFMRLLTQARLDLRAARERRRDDVTDADGDARTICEDGHERGPGDDLRAGDNLADRLPQERIPWTTSWSCRGG